MPNLLFITTDQQRFDTLPCYGLDFIETDSPKSPLQGALALQPRPQRVLLGWCMLLLLLGLHNDGLDV